MYAEDGRVITGSGDVKVGRDEIEALFQGFIDSGFGEHKITVRSRGHIERLQKMIDAVAAR